MTWVHSASKAGTGISQNRMASTRATSHRLSIFQPDGRTELRPGRGGEQHAQQQDHLGEQVDPGEHARLAEHVHQVAGVADGVQGAWPGKPRCRVPAGSPAVSRPGARPASSPGARRYAGPRRSRGPGHRDRPGAPGHRGGSCRPARRSRLAGPRGTRARPCGRAPGCLGVRVLRAVASAPAGRRARCRPCSRRRARALLPLAVLPVAGQPAPRSCAPAARAPGWRLAPGVLRPGLLRGAGVVGGRDDADLARSAAGAARRADSNPSGSRAAGTDGVTGRPQLPQNASPAKRPSPHPTHFSHIGQSFARSGIIGHVARPLCLATGNLPILRMDNRSWSE